jgi:hypothetical protein
VYLPSTASKRPLVDVLKSVFSTVLVCTCVFLGVLLVIFL